jgi:Zn-dependent M28 family amino/carboxypeptidase
MSQQEYTDPKIKLAEEKGAIAVLQVTPSAKGSGIIALSRRYKQVNDEEPIVPGKRRILSLNNSTPYWSWNRMPELYISREMAELILGLPPQGKAGGQLEKLAKKIGENFKPQSRELPRVLITIKNTFNTKIVTGSNVLGFIEGSDADLKDEAVIIGAHLDHLGKRGDYIYNGAADNASGSAAVLELARAFALNPVKPKRTILFALWTGEEHGMLGSRFYTDHPYFPLKKTVAYLNMDMIGWEWENKDLLVGILERRGYDIPEKILEEIDLSKFLMPTLAKESEEMYETIKTCRHYVGFTLCLRKSGGKIGGSDYVPFARNNIAWTHFSTGLKKYYHHPGDSIDKINFDMVRDVARFIYTIAFSFADR